MVIEIRRMVTFGEVFAEKGSGVLVNVSQAALQEKP